MTIKLSLSDDSIMEVMSINKVKIKSFDGVVHILEDIAYIPKMQKNQLLLNLLDFQSCSYKVGSRVLEIIQSWHGIDERKITSRIVLAKKKYNKNLKGLERSCI